MEKKIKIERIEKENCVYCKPGPVVVSNYDKREAGRYAYHMKHHKDL